MTNEIHELKNEVLRWKEKAEKTQQELKAAEETVNKYGQFMINPLLLRVISFVKDKGSSR